MDDTGWMDAIKPNVNKCASLSLTGDTQETGDLSQSSDLTSYPEIISPGLIQYAGRRSRAELKCWPSRGRRRDGRKGRLKNKWSM